MALNRGEFIGERNRGPTGPTGPPGTVSFANAMTGPTGAPGEGGGAGGGYYVEVLDDYDIYGSEAGSSEYGQATGNRGQTPCEFTMPPAFIPGVYLITWSVEVSVCNALVSEFAVSVYEYSTGAIHAHEKKTVSGALCPTTGIVDNTGFVGQGDIFLFSGSFVFTELYEVAPDLCLRYAIAPPSEINTPYLRVRRQRMAAIRIADIAGGLE